MLRQVGSKKLGSGWEEFMLGDVGTRRKSVKKADFSILVIIFVLILHFKKIYMCLQNFRV